MNTMPHGRIPVSAKSLQMRHMKVMMSQITRHSTVCLTVYANPHHRGIKVSISGPLWGELFTDDWWISRTKGQRRGKGFHVMTSSWEIVHGIATGMSARTTVHQSEARNSNEHVVKVPYTTNTLVLTYVYYVNRCEWNLWSTIILQNIWKVW